ncbi:MAG: PD-(D/E)XK nuclease family protein [Clostridiales bacterium]|nr:PD-(D/E)XK nuclease family protein [Clostridiales bacterium]
MPDVRVLTARPHRLLPPIIKQIGELHRNKKSCVLLVPEQFTLQAEREILARLKLPGLFSVEIISPTRLRRRVTAAVGTDEWEPLSAAGQHMAVSFALETCADRLKYYHAAVSRHGFAQKLTALITDMKRGGLQPETLAEYAAGLPDGMQKGKLQDIAVLYAAYQQTLQDRMVDSDDLNQFVTEHLDESGLMRGQHVFTYGFDAMSEPLIVLLCAIAGSCERLTVGLISDSAGAADQEIYLPVRQSVARFRRALEDHGIDLKETAVTPEPLRHAPAIEHLDRMLFSYPQQMFEGEQSNVFLSQFNSPYEEATHAARQILRLSEEGVSLERIAVLYPDQNGYPFAVAAALADSGFPFYTDEKLPALSHALVQFIMAALHAMADGFRNEDVFTLMKTGYANIGFDDACTLENYAREYGIDHSRWLQPFRKGDVEVRSRTEAMRKAVILPLIKARDALVAARDTAQSLQAVMDLLNEADAYNALKREEEALLKENLLVRAGQNSQIWQAVLELMDQLYILSGGRRIPLKYIANRFECGFSAVALATLPPAANMLHAGVLGHYLSGEMDAVFLLGMNDGILTRSTESLLTEDERARAQENTQSFLGMTEESRLAFARLDIKRAMTLPQRYLYLSYAKIDPAGNALQPLDLANDMEDRLFESLPENTDTSLPVSSGQALVTLSDLLRKYADGDEERLPDVWKQRLAKLLSSPVTAGQTLRLMRAAGYRVETVPLAAEAARNLFEDRTLSVSRLEEYAACPFRHYITYGLLPREQKEWEVTPIERGNFFHDSLQRFAQIAAENPRYPHVSQEDVNVMVDDAAAPLVAELKNGPMGDGPRSLASLEQAKRVVRRACAAVTDHLASGSFRLEKAEAKFGYPGEDSFPPVTLKLKDGTEITLHGRIDRIDSYQAKDAAYRRVVDYKSGAASADASAMWQGTQLQLMLYLDAVTRNTGEAKPAGAFYFHLFDPLSKADAEQEDAIKEDIQKQLQMNGVALMDTDVLQAMDAGDTQVSIPSAVTKTGAPRKKAKALDEKHLDALMDHSKLKAGQFAQRMFEGDISIHPVIHGVKSSCDYCEYRSICGYDPLARGAQATEIYKLEMEELAQRLDGENDN